MDWPVAYAVKISIVEVVIPVNVRMKTGVKIEDAPLRITSTIVMNVNQIVGKVYWLK